MKLLVIEDEKLIRDLLIETFEKEGFDVETCPDGESGLATAQNGDWDLIVLDIGLPGMNGFEVLKALREGGSTTPLVVLTAMDSEENLVRGLDLGADTFLRKPFPMAALVAHAQALLRRSTGPGTHTIAFDDLKLDLQRRLAMRNGQPLRLTDTQFKLLTVLIQAQGEVVSRSTLLREVWGIDFDPETKILDVQLSYLRTKLGKLGPPIITLVRGVGYRLSPPSDI